MESKDRNTFWNWNLTEKEYREQVEGYSSIEFNKSIRGQIFWFFAFISAVTLAMSFFLPEFVDTTTAITSLVIYGVLTFLVIKGLRWGYVVFLAWWVIDKAVTIWASVTEGYASSVVSGFVFLAIGVILLIKGIKIENARHKLMNQEAT